jgi:hypothetical protein
MLQLYGHSMDVYLRLFYWLYVSWVQANSLNESSCCFWECENKNSGHRFCNMVYLKSSADYYILVYTHCWS